MKIRKIKIIGILLALFFGIFLISFNKSSAQLASSTSSGRADSPWPMLQHDLRHTGLSPYTTKGVDGTVKWTFETGAGIESSPTIAQDGTIYIGSHDNKLYALKPDGSLKWKFNAGDPVYVQGWDVFKGIPSAPTIGKDGTIYFISPPIYLFALNPDGTEKWRHPIYTAAHMAASPVIAPDGTIYVGSESYPHNQKQKEKQEIGARVYALNPDGTERWRYDTEGSCLANPIAVAPDGTLYATGSYYEPGQPTTGNALLAFNPDGSIKWKFITDRIEGPPSIASDGTIYIGTKEGKLIALNPDGSQKWFFQAGSGIAVMAAQDKNGNLYFGSWDGNFYALNKDGKELWRFDVKKGRDPQMFGDYPYKETITGSATISADGTIYFGDVVDTFYALDLKGKEKWRHKNEQGSGFGASAAIGSDGTVYVGSLDKKVYAFGSPKEKTEKKERGLFTNRTIIYIFGGLVFLIILTIFIIFLKKISKKPQAWDKN